MWPTFIDVTSIQYHCFIARTRDGLASPEMFASLIVVTNTEAKFSSSPLLARAEINRHSNNRPVEQSVADANCADANVYKYNGQN